MLLVDAVGTEKVAWNDFRQRSWPRFSPVAVARASVLQLRSRRAVLPILICTLTIPARLNEQEYSAIAKWLTKLLLRCE